MFEGMPQNNISVSFNDFTQNVSHYFDLASLGDVVEIIQDDGHPIIYLRNHTETRKVQRLEPATRFARQVITMFNELNADVNAEIQIMQMLISSKPPALK